MQTIRYRTKINGSVIQIPADLLDEVKDNAEVEVVLRPIEFNSSTKGHSDQIIRDIK